MKHIKLFEQFITEAKFPGKKGEFIYNDREGYVEIKKTAGSTAYVKWSYTGASSFNQVWADEVKLSDEKHNGKRVWLMESNELNERYVTKRDIEGWEKDNGKLPFPPEVLAATKLMAKYKLADDDQLTRAHIWYRFHYGSWIDMEKFGAHVKKFYGSDFYTEFSSGYTSMFMEAKAHAASIMALIEDKNANGEAIEPAYYEVKEWFKNHDLDYKRNRIFNAAVEYVQKWLKESGIKTL